jgi:uncharacterized protein (TIGR04255 family)
MEKITKLSAPPLVETIFELRWRIPDPNKPDIVDPEYKILIGKLFESIKEEYPFYEQLPTSDIPDSISGYVVQYRFRTAKDDWPLIQLGPGIITLNDTEQYEWEDFEARIGRLLSSLAKIHPKYENIEIMGILLRYIDAHHFDFEKQNILEFLHSKLKIEVNFPESLFKGTKVREVPIGINLGFSFYSTKPKGAFHLRFGKGDKMGEPALIWETVVQSLGKDIPNGIDELVNWTKDAHELTHEWFFKLIEGDLLEEFR